MIIKRDITFQNKFPNSSLEMFQSQFDSFLYDSLKLFFFFIRASLSRL